MRGQKGAWFIGSALLVSVTAGCSAASIGNPTAPPTTTNPTSSAKPTSPKAVRQDNNSGPLGTTFTATDIDGNKMKVTLIKVIDPAQGSDEFTTPDNGKRFAAAEFRLTGLSGHMSDDANGDATLVGSNHQTYSADFDDIKGCTNFNSGEFSVTPGEQSVGCVVYQVPKHVKVAQIQWDASGGYGDTPPATWNL